MARCTSQAFVCHIQTVDAKWRQKAWLGESQSCVQMGSWGNGSRAAVVLEEVTGGSDCRSENSVQGLFSEREAMSKKMEVVVSLGF